jgi:hypothetical protein
MKFCARVGYLQLCWQFVYIWAGMIFWNFSPARMQIFWKQLKNVLKKVLIEKTLPSCLWPLRICMYSDDGSKKRSKRCAALGSDSDWKLDVQTKTTLPTFGWDYFSDHKIYFSIGLRSCSWYVKTRTWPSGINFECSPFVHPQEWTLYLYICTV